MARVIQGIPVSWDPSIANIRLPSKIQATAWSPCSRFIAVATFDLPVIVVLDAGTLEQLHTMYFPSEYTWDYITFSPGTHLLTAYSYLNGYIVNWDLQTGGVLSNFSTLGYDTSQSPRCNSMSYSMCGEMIGVSFSNNTIIVYNVLSGKFISSHSTKQPIVKMIWTHGEFLQFATIESGSIATWQVNFTSSHTPTRVGSLPTPHDFSSKGLVLLPATSRLAFILDNQVVVWDALHHKALLHSADAKNPRAMSFSPEGHFFLCGTKGRGFYIWRESPTGYLLHQKLVSGASEPTPCISLNGESVISSSGQILQLWHTKNSSTSLPTIPIQTAYHQNTQFLVDFSSDQSLVALTQTLSSTVTVLDTKSGNPWLVIDTDAPTCGLRMTEGQILVVCEGKIVTWDFPARNSVFNLRRDTNDSVQTIALKHPQPTLFLQASISPNLDYVAFGTAIPANEALSIYSMHSREKLATASSDGYRVRFTPNGHEVWCATMKGKLDQWEIVKENGSNAITLKRLKEDAEVLCGFPWLSSYGYQVTNDGWILDSSEKCLFWLPHHWRPDTEFERVWSRKFLAVWNDNSSEPYILEMVV